jgi:hypothetical protein
MRKNIFLLLIAFISFKSFSQDAIEYKTPPKEIYDLVTAKATPTVDIVRGIGWSLWKEAVCLRLRTWHSQNYE